MNRILLCFLFCLPIFASAQDYAREQRLASEIEAALVVGELVWINGEQQRPFLGLYTQPSSPRGPTLLLLHGRGVHPEFGIVGQLRSRLADAGHATLAIQLPVWDVTAPASKYQALQTIATQRLQAAQQWLLQQGQHDVIPVAHSLGARMTAGALTRRALQPRCWVAIGYLDGRLPATPVLDLIAEHDFPDVLKAAPTRARQPQVTARRIAGADHYFNSHAAAVADAVLQYVQQCPPAR